MISQLSFRATCKQGRLTIGPSRISLKGDRGWELDRAAVAGVRCAAGLLTADLTVVARDGRKFALGGVSFREALAVIELLGYLSGPRRAESAAEPRTHHVEIAGNYTGSKLVIEPDAVCLDGKQGWTLARNAITAVRCTAGPATAGLNILTADGRHLHIESLPFNGALRAFEMLNPPSATSDGEADPADTVPSDASAQDLQSTPAPPSGAPVTDPPPEPATPPEPLREPEPRPLREPGVRLASRTAAAPAHDRPYTMLSGPAYSARQRAKRKQHARASAHNHEYTERQRRPPARAGASTTATDAPPASSETSSAPTTEPITATGSIFRAPSARASGGPRPVELGANGKLSASAVAQSRVEAFCASIRNDPDASPKPAPPAPSAEAAPPHPSADVTPSAAIIPPAKEDEAPAQPSAGSPPPPTPTPAPKAAPAARKHSRAIKYLKSIRALPARGLRLLVHGVTWVAAMVLGVEWAVRRLASASRSAWRVTADTVRAACLAAGTAVRKTPVTLLSTLRATTQRAGKRALIALLTVPLVFTVGGAARHTTESGIIAPAPNATHQRPQSAAPAPATPAGTPVQKVFVGSYDGSVYALTASDGHLIWRFGSGAGVESSPTYAAGVIYFGSGDHYIYALRTVDRQVLWRYQTGSKVVAAPTVVNGVLYAGSTDGYLYAFRAGDGALLWRFKTGGGIESRPAVANGVVVVGSDDHSVYVIRASDGRSLWWYQTGGAVSSSPAIVNGVIYVGSADNRLYALRLSDGALFWRYMTGGSLLSSPTVVAGAIYIGSSDGALYALRANNGALLWRYTTGSRILSSPAAVDGAVYVGSSDGALYALRANNGALLWRYSTRGPITSSPAVVAGAVYVGSSDHSVYALDAHSGRLLWSYETGNVVNWLPAVGA